MATSSQKPTFYVNPLASSSAGFNQKGPVIVGGSGKTPYGVVHGGTFYPNPIAPNPSYIIPTPSRTDLNTYKNPSQTPAQYVQSQAFKNLPAQEQKSYLAANGLAPRPNSYTITNSSDVVTEGDQVTFSINRFGGDLNQSEKLLIQSSSQNYETYVRTSAGQVLSTRGARTAADFQLDDQFITFEPGESSKTFVLNTLINPLSNKEFARFSLILSRAEANGRYAHAANSGQIIITDTIQKTYMLSGVPEYNEGTGLNFSLYTTGISDGSTVYWKIDSSSIGSEDLGKGSLSGSVIIKNNAASIIEPILADFKKEGIETGSISIYADPGFINSVGNTLQFSIKDTSTPVYTSQLQQVSLPNSYKDLIIDYKGYSIGYGNQGSNTLTGNNFSNKLVAGSGRDVLTGGGGQDTFLIAGPIEYGAARADVITDYNRAEGDLLNVSRSAIGYTRTSGFERVITALDDTSLSAALGTSNSFVYDQRSGEIYFNQNGLLAGHGSGGVFAILENRASLISIGLEA